MELKFIWIKKYKNIHNTGFNFNYGGGEAFEFRNGELLISGKKPGLKGFFRENITGVTAIVGKNGSGKTNLTEFINYNLAHVKNGNMATYGVGEGIIIIDRFVFVQKRIKLNNRAAIELQGYKVIRFKNAPLDDEVGELQWYRMEESKYIYYNPTFDLRSVDVNQNLINISTTALVYNDIRNSNKLYNLETGKREPVSKLEAFEAMENERVCDFILNFTDPDPVIDFLPKAMRIKVDRIRNNHFLEQHIYSEELTGLQKEKFVLLQRELDSAESYLAERGLDPYFTSQDRDFLVIPEEGQKEFFFRLLFINIFQGLLNMEKVFPRGYMRTFLYEPKLQPPPADSLQRRLYRLRDSVQELLDAATWESMRLKVENGSYAKQAKNMIYETLGGIKYPVANSAKVTLLNGVLQQMDGLLNGRRIVSCEPLGGLSSGQKHWLNLFARFFWAKRQIDRSEKDTYGIRGENIIVFIDEGEVALHPEWQRVFFSKVTGFLNELFEGRNIQLLLTTHSPFVLSDIPKDNVIFLERDAQGHCRVSQMDRENTFGANIYALLADSFFMQNTVGAFAAEKMQGALAILRSGHRDYSKETLDELRHIIAAIGEPVIQQQFEMLYNTKFGNDEVGALQRRIRELENRLKQQSDDTAEN